MTQPYKVCPNCQQPAVLSMPRCGRCGRVYQTTGLQQTQVVVPFSPPDHSLRDAQLDQLATEYKSLTNLLYFTMVCIGIPTGGFGLIVGFLLWMRYADIRRRVSELGVPPEEWERPLKDYNRKVAFYWLLAFLVICVVGVLIFTRKS